MMPFLRSRRVLLLLGLVVTIGVGIAVYFWLANRHTLPGRDSSKYQAYQRAFQVGVAALDAGREDVARKNLDQAIELIPDEPAGWANRALLHLRKNNLKEAAADLKRAQELAPESGEIESLLGLLAEKQGRYAESVAHLRRGIEKNPRDLASLFFLAEAVSKEGGANHEAEYQRLMEQILKVQPNNLPVLMQRAGAAFRSKDKAALRDTIDRLTRLAPAWKPGSRKALDELRKAIEDAPAEVPFLMTGLDNLLRGEHGYIRDSFFIHPTGNTIGTPVLHFLRLEPARPSPAPPDHELAFALEAVPIVGKEPTRWDVVLPVWLLSEVQRNALVAGATLGGIESRPADAFKPAIFLANAREVRRADADAPILPFPSGPKAVAPTLVGMVAVDWNNDLRTDLLLAGAGGLRFWQQQADGTFSDVSPKTGLPVDILNGDYYGAWAADLESDGDLDLIVARRSGPPLVLRNNGDGTFKTIELFADVKDARGFVWADLDNDGAAEAICLDAAGKLHIFANDRSGQFSRWPLFDNLGTFHAITAADVNGDGVLDLVALRADRILMRISAVTAKSGDRTTASWHISELANPLTLSETAVGTVAIIAADLDNNGAPDIVVAGAREAQFFLADQKGEFSSLPISVSLGGATVLDLNRDGQLDLLGLSPQGQPVRALNQSKKGYRWQVIWPLATPKAGDNRVNSFGLGGEVEVRAGALVSKQRITGPVVHFGLGEQQSADVARIVWPNGVPQWEFVVPADRLIIAGQRLSGSCPFLFTYDGTGMKFAGDFMWGTPLGMYINGQNIGDFPQTTEWLKIRGDHLVPKDGYYDVRVHANLWEVDFFDQLALLVVDHPADTEIHVDERFFLTPTKPRLHVTTQARAVAGAWDHHGKDALDEVKEIDGRYLDRAGRGRFQGVTQDHWVEVELGDDAPHKGPVLLVARGWLQPTNSSINVALSQGKHDAPKPLSLEVPDGKGGWRAALPALGFPAGKDKTMLIRLDGIDADKGVCRRFRLRTSMEIYWDFLGYATELDPELASIQRPTPLAADLRYRGVLEMSKKNASSPEVPHYDKVNLGGQPWRDLTGYYTRFGDVRELLAKVDDRYVIMNAGDEIALRFPVPTGPATGSRRDFIWECDGWTRDGDLNTRFGNTVVPMPAHNVKSDDRPPGRLHDDAVFQRFPRDWQIYHTRYVTCDVFARGLHR